MSISFNSLFYSLILVCLLMGCSGSRPSQSTSNVSANQSVPENNFTVQGQILGSDNVSSIQLYRKGASGSAPIISLNSNQKLRLQFDMIGFDSHQFIAAFTHHNPDWTRSSQPPEFFQDGFYNVTLDGGQLSRTERPSYRQYSFDFPNSQITFLRSGNYMLRIEDADSGHTLFTLPFFVTENRGEIISSVESFPTPRQRLRTTDRPVSRYQLPDFVEQPQFDLEFYFVQNQFWGRQKKATELDFSNDFEVQFETRNDQSFIADYEFNRLQLDDISIGNPQIEAYRPTEIPQRVVLRDDAQGFTGGPPVGRGRFGAPAASLNAKYLNVVFNLDPAELLSDQSDIFLVGDFNNWSLQTRNRLTYQPELDRWQTRSLIKEGLYSYKYVLLENNQVQDLIFDDQFRRGNQEYHAFVYMRDHEKHYYRLLQINHFFSDS